MSHDEKMQLLRNKALDIIKKYEDRVFYCMNTSDCDCDVDLCFFSGQAYTCLEIAYLFDLIDDGEWQDGLRHLLSRSSAKTVKSLAHAAGLYPIKRPERESP